MVTIGMWLLLECGCHSTYGTNRGNTVLAIAIVTCGHVLSFESRVRIETPCLWLALMRDRGVN